MKIWHRGRLVADTGEGMNSDEITIEAGEARIKLLDGALTMFGTCNHPVRCESAGIAIDPQRSFCFDVPKGA